MEKEFEKDTHMYICKTESLRRTPETITHC